MDEAEFMEPQTENLEGINYLTAAGVLRLHAHVMGCTFEEARNHVLKPRGLESAVMRPQNAAHYEDDADIPLQAAYLAHAIAEGQIFVEGNKRTALVCMETFLEVNGWWLTADDDELADWMINLSRGLSVYDLAQLIREHSKAFWEQDK